MIHGTNKIIFTKTISDYEKDFIIYGLRNAVCDIV